MRKKINIFLWLAIFGIAFAYIETAVVIYLRQIYYPHGFDFPMAEMDPFLAKTEIFREAMTLLLLLSISMIAGKNSVERFAYFVFSFAIWDIFYYVFLKLLLNWPPSFLTWDILFLIPLPWIGPVITPVIVSLTMIFFSIATIYLSETGYNVKIAFREFLIMSSGCLVIFISFISDFAIRIIVSPEKGISMFNYYPEKFHWFIFFMGEAVLLTGIFLFIKKTRRRKFPIQA